MQKMNCLSFAFNEVFDVLLDLVFDSILDLVLGLVFDCDLHFE